MHVVIYEDHPCLCQRSMGLRDAFQNPVVHIQSPKLNQKTSLRLVPRVHGVSVWLLQCRVFDV